MKKLCKQCEGDDELTSGGLCGHCWNDKQEADRLGMDLKEYVEATHNNGQNPQRAHTKVFVRYAFHARYTAQRVRKLMIEQQASMLLVSLVGYPDPEIFESDGESFDVSEGTFSVNRRGSLYILSWATCKAVTKALRETLDPKNNGGQRVAINFSPFDLDELEDEDGEHLDVMGLDPDSGKATTEAFDWGSK